MQQELGLNIKVKHRGFSEDRIKPLTKKQLDAAQGHDHGCIERGLAEVWEEQNRAQPCVNYGGGILQDLITSAHIHKKLPRWFKDLEVNSRDAALVAEVVQWMGTNCGLAFLETAFRRAGYEFKYLPKNTEEKRWKRNWKARNKRRQKREAKKQAEEERKKGEAERPRNRFVTLE